MANKKRYFKLLAERFSPNITSATESRYSLSEEMRAIIRGVQEGELSGTMQYHRDLSDSGYALICPIAANESRHDTWNWHHSDVVECDKDGVPLPVQASEDLF